MLQLSYMRLLLLICTILSVSFLSSCDKDDSAINNGQVELLSFGPTGAKHGDTLRFIGQNLDKVTAIQFTGTDAVVNQSDFKSQTADLILLLVPTGAQKGVVTLKTPGGDVVSKSQLNLNVKTAAAITSVTKQARPGENITLSGNYLNWVNRIIFNKDKVVTSFVSQSQNQLVVKVPMDAQTGPLMVTFSGTDTLDVQTADTVKVALPTATAMAPNPVKHTENLTLTGTDLDLTTGVRFAGVTTPVTSFESKTATQLVVKVPATAVKGKITLIAPSGVTTQSATDLEIAMPATTSMAPTPVDPGGELTITGTNLDLVTGIRFPEVTAAVTSFVSQSATQIKVMVPAGAAKGKLTFTVRNTTLTSQSAQEIQITGGAAEIPFKVTVFGDGFDANWEAWGGWGTATQDFNNTEQVKSGSKAIKATFSDAYGALQLHPKTNFAVPGIYSTIRLSIYGGNNATATSRVAIYLKDATDPTDAQKVKLTLVPGRYTTFEIPLSSFTNNPAKINEFVIQNYGTANMTIYVDEVGFY